jgi:hypothetical protein
LAIIGVDISGQVGTDPPVYAVGVKYLRRNEQKHEVVCLSPSKHDEYDSCTKNWCEKISAILIYLAALGVYTSHDVVVIDCDFEGKRRLYVERYLKRLFGERFVGKYPLNDPNILWQPAQINDTVKKAHVKSQRARHRLIEPNITDPNLEREIGWLKKL